MTYEAMLNEYVKLALGAIFETDEQAYMAYKREIPKDLHFNMENFLGKEISMKDIVNWYRINNMSTVTEFRLMYSFPIITDDENHVFIRLNKSGDKEVRLSRDPKILPSDMIRPIISMLKTVGNIPVLYLIFGKSFDTKYVYHKEYAHDYWLLSVLKSFIINPSEEEFIKIIKSPGFLKVKRQIDYVPKMLGRGADGIALSIGPDKVLKIYLDDYLYNKTKEDWERLHKYPKLSGTESMIYDVGEMCKYHGLPIYYTILQKFKTLDTSQRDILRPILGAIAFRIQDYQKKLALLKEILHDIERHDMINKSVQQYTGEILNYVHAYGDIEDNIQEISAKFPDLKKNWLEILIKEMLMKYLTRRTDLHANNIGINNMGEFRFFDPSHKDFTSIINVP